MSFDKELYLSLLAAQVGVPYKYIEPLAFADCATKLDVNKKFFAEVLPRLMDNVSVELPDGLRKFLAKGGFSQNHVIERATAQLNYARREMENFWDAYSELAERLSEASLAYYEALKFDPLQVLEESLTKVLAKGKWEYSTNTGEHAFFVSKDPIVMHYKDDDAGVDYSVDFGKATVKVKFNPLRVVVSFEHRMPIDYPHPHVNRAGSVCWGNAAGVVNKAAETYDVEPLFEALHLILTNYNPASPYVNLRQYYEEQDRGRALQEFERFAETVMDILSRRNLNGSDIAKLFSLSYAAMRDSNSPGLTERNIGHDTKLETLHWVVDEDATSVLARHVDDEGNEWKLVPAFRTGIGLSYAIEEAGFGWHMYSGGPAENFRKVTDAENWLEAVRFPPGATSFFRSYGFLRPYEESVSVTTLRPQEETEDTEETEDHDDEEIF